MNWLFLDSWCTSQQLRVSSGTCHPIKNRGLWFKGDDTQNFGQNTDHQTTKGQGKFCVTVNIASWPESVGEKKTWSKAEVGRRSKLKPERVWDSDYTRLFFKWFYIYKVTKVVHRNQSIVNGQRHGHLYHYHKHRTHHMQSLSVILFFVVVVLREREPAASTSDQC